MASIDIGDGATDRAGADGPGWTDVSYSNPANASGTITSIEIWANTNLTGCEVGIFYVVSGNNLSTRSTVTIGNVTAGSKQTFIEDSGSNPISLAVQAGDFIGIYATGGTFEYESSGSTGVWGSNNDYIPCTNEAFSFYNDDGVSIAGTGVTIEGENAIFFGANF